VTIRIVLVDDHPIVLAGLMRLLGSERDLEIVDSIGTGKEALSAVLRHAPDILLLDLQMPVMNGIAVLSELKRQHAPTKVIVLTAISNDDVLTAVRLGARGIVLKDMAPRLLVECVRVVHSGGTWIEKSLATRALYRMQPHSAAPSLIKNLTPREVEVARMIAEGLPTKRVADMLAITVGTAKLHVHHIYSKLNVPGRVALVRYMQRHGLV
jgi:DNA-binding NarL/FixJ family response regulator